MPATPTDATSAKGRQTTAGRMRAVIQDSYDSFDGLKIEEIERPSVEDDQVLIRVRAASINPADLHRIKGPMVARLGSGLRKPKNRVPGADVAGVVEAVGKGVADLQPGDEVFGTCRSSLAEYAAGGKNLVPKPPRLSFEQAGSIGIAGITALQGLRDRGRIQPGQSVLINGAAGGVGTFAVQIGKALGAEVTGVCSTRNLDLVRSIGADRLIDYTAEDFARTGQLYDLVFDVVGNRALSDLRRVLKPGGTLVLCGGAHDRGHGARGLVRPLTLLAGGLIVSRFVNQKIAFFIAQINKPDLLTLKGFIEAGTLTPIVDRTYALTEISEAFRYLQTGHARAKVVITL